MFVGMSSEVLSMDIKEGENLTTDSMKFNRSSVRGELAIRTNVGKVIFPGKVGVFCSLHDARSEIFVGVAYCNFRVGKEPIIGMLLPWKEVTSAAARDK